LKVLIDTNIFIQILKKAPDALREFENLVSQKAEFFYNPVIEAEILQGAKETQIPDIETVLSFCTCLDIDCETGKIAAQFVKEYLKSHHTITLDDYLIAATAKQHNLFIWTQNKKHFPMLKKEGMI